MTTFAWQFNISEDKHNDRFEDDIEGNGYTFLKRSLYERLLSRVLQMLPSINENEEKEEPDEEEFLEVIGSEGDLIF